MSEDAPTTRARRQVGPAALRALAHPLRVRIIDTLAARGPLTASRLGELLAESSGSTSYHLRQLEKHGFVREVEGRGTARERWWERTPGGFTVTSDEDDDVAARMASDLVNVEFERAREEKIMAFLRAGALFDDEARRRWRDATTLTTITVRATPEELTALVRAWEDFELEHVQPLMGRDDVPGGRAAQVHFNVFPIVDADGQA